MFVDDLRVVTDQPLPADGEAAEALALRDAGFLEQVQAAAAGADEDKLRPAPADFAGGQVPDADIPAFGRFFQVNHPVVAGDAAAGLAGEPREQLAGDHPEIHIGAAVHLGRGDRNVAAALDQERGPGADRRAVGGVGHFPEKMVGGHPSVPRLQEIHLFRAMDKADVRDRVDELPRVAHHAAGHCVAPELLRLLELLEDSNRLGDVDRPVGLARRGVAQLADAGVAGAGVVPAVGAFLRQFLRDLVDLDGEVGLQPLEHGAEVGGHDAAADQDDIGVLDVRGVLHQGADS